MKKLIAWVKQRLSRTQKEPRKLIRADAIPYKLGMNGFVDEIFWFSYERGIVMGWLHRKNFPRVGDVLLADFDGGGGHPLRYVGPSQYVFTKVVPCTESNDRFYAKVAYVDNEGW